MASITVRRLGYLQRKLEFDLNAGTTKEPLEILLTPVATDVEAVTIEGATGRLQAFNERRVRNNFGYFFDQNDIRRKSPRYVSELFRAIPGARLQASRRTGNVLELRNCTPRIWIDGVRADNSEIDELISPSEIGGIEIYPSFAGVPARNTWIRRTRLAGWCWSGLGRSGNRRREAGSGKREAGTGKRKRPGILSEKQKPFDFSKGFAFVISALSYGAPGLGAAPLTPQFALVKLAGSGRCRRR